MRAITPIIFFISLSHHLLAASLSNEQKRQILICVDAYKNAICLYSAGKDIDQNVILRNNLRKLVSNPAESIHYADLSLFNNEIVNQNQLNEPFLTYLIDIDERFRSKNVSVEFNKITPIDCIDGNVGVVGFEKKITVDGIEKTFSEIILINLPQNENDGKGYTISEVLSSENYKGENNLCSGSIQVGKSDLDVYQKRKDADSYFFNKKDYLTAKNLYEYILTKKPDDKYYIDQINLCNKSLTRLDYLNKANIYFDNAEYKQAVEWYQKLLAEYPSDIDKNAIKNRIEASKQGLIDKYYKNDISKADAGFANGDFNNARYYYEQALQIKPEDNYAINKLDQAKVNDDRYAEKEISRVVQLASQSSKYYGEYFRVLMKYEGYGNHIRLWTKLYYNIVLMLNSYDSHIMNEMHFTRKDCRSYCSIYCKKLNDRYYNERDQTLREDIRNLLDNVINKRNQN